MFTKLLKYCLAPVLLWLSMPAAPAKAQNLVPNGNFELYNNCALGYGNINYSPGYNSFQSIQNWVSNLSNNQGTYLRLCPGNTTVFGLSTPTNDFGYQVPHSGVGYAVLRAYYYLSYTGPSDAGRSIIADRLSSSLVKDSFYSLSFFVSPTEGNFSSNPARLNEIGAHFSTGLPTSTTATSLSLSYSIANDTNRHLTDTSRWYEVFGLYKAQGGEQFITIGSFANSLYPALTNASPSDLYIDCYDYIDDVSAYKVSVARPIVHYISCDAIHQGAATLQASVAGARYVWNTGDTVRTIQISSPGVYSCISRTSSTWLVDTFYASSALRPTTQHLKACDGQGHKLALQSASPAGSHFKWSTGDTSRSITAPQPGLYTCKASNACDAVIDSFFVSADTVAKLITVPVCNSFGNGVLLTSLVSQSPYYVWNTGDTTQSIYVSQQGDFTCYAFDGCNVIRDTFRVVKSTAAAPPIVHDTILCKGILAPLLTINDTSVLWYNSATAVSGTTSQPIINTSAPNTITLYVAARRGSCVSDKVLVTIRVIDKPAAHAVDSSLHCEQDLSGSPLPVGTYEPGDVSYNWSNGATECCIYLREDGMYIRTATNLCGSVADTFVRRPVTCDDCLIFPTAFTPNDDGHNDGFGVILRCPAISFTLNIYNRWGQLIYRSQDPKERWNGYVLGRPAPVGLYMYMASMKYALTGKVFFVKGELTLVR